jgi:hypothetical protein
MIDYEGFPSNPSRFITRQSTCLSTPFNFHYWQLCYCYSSSTDATTTTTTTTTTNNNNNNNNNNGRDSVVGIVATGYTVRGSNPGGGEFSAPFHTCPGAHSASYTMGPGSFPGVKWSGRGFNHPPPSSAEVKEGVDLYFYSPSGPLWQVIGWTFMSVVVVVVVVVAAAVVVVVVKHTNYSISFIYNYKQ